MRFKNREHAATLLAARLSSYKGQSPLVLGVPRGAVPMARIIASALDGELNVVLVRKLRAPYQAELAIGAIDEAGAVLTGRHLDRAEVSEEYLREEIRTQSEVLRRRRRLYTGTRPQSTATARVVIIVDDGIATGSSMLAAIRSVRAQRPRKIVVAIAVAAPESLGVIQKEADEVVCLHSPEDFYAVGQFFENFSEVTDDMVVAALAGAVKAVTHAHAET
ncbi:MAG TPA: phosphoribosyltransferase family protein [Vicinamibacterales bacterium]|nr:phosphoribosyltransferase family protein [Vicinamibacterales bacterium]